MHLLRIVLIYNFEVDYWLSLQLYYNTIQKQVYILRPALVRVLCTSAEHAPDIQAVQNPSKALDNI
eukprot:2119733-Heterocapsa_arctica.AAC.1